MSVLLACRSMYHLHVVLVEARDGIGCPETGATDSSEVPHNRWESSLGPLEEWPVLLHDEPTLQPLLLQSKQQQQTIYAGC